MQIYQPPPPGPMPDVQNAQVYLPDAAAAIERAKAAWNATQMRDALGSARRFIDAAESLLRKAE